MLEQLSSWDYQYFAARLGKGLLIVIIGWILSKWVYRLTVRLGGARKLDLALVKFLGSIFQYAVLAAALISALSSLGIQTASLLAIFASAGLAVGLALQGSLSNFASGVMILIFRPFSLGEKVTAAGRTGKVTDIGIFNTVLLTPDSETIIIPNSKVTGDCIVNFTGQGKLRGCVDVGVAYGADVNRVREVLIAAAMRSNCVLEDPEPSVFFAGLGASSLDFKVYAWSAVPDYLAMINSLRQSVYDDLNAAGIEIPFAQIVVHKADAEG